jgi:hypothetical protein
MRTQCNCALCIAGHRLKVVAEQLHADRCTTVSETALEEFWTDVMEHPVRISTIHHPHEFRDHPVKPSLGGDQAAKVNIGEPLHRGEDNAHGTGLLKGELLITGLLRWPGRNNRAAAFEPAIHAVNTGPAARSSQ